MLNDGTVILNVTTAARQYPVTGLAQGTQYKFKVCTINLAGRGPWSDTNTQTTSTPQTPGAPGVPTLISITSADATINWTTPTQLGGSAITRYAVQYKKMASAGWQSSSNNVQDLSLIHI